MTDIATLLGRNAESLLNHICRGIPRNSLHLSDPDFIDCMMVDSDRSPAVLRNMLAFFDHGRLVGNGYLSLLLVG